MSFVRLFSRASWVEQYESIAAAVSGDTRLLEKRIREGQALSDEEKAFLIDGLSKTSATKPAHRPRKLSTERGQRTRAVAVRFYEGLLGCSSTDAVLKVSGAFSVSTRQVERDLKAYPPDPEMVANFVAIARGEKLIGAPVLIRPPRVYPAPDAK